MTFLLKESNCSFNTDFPILKYDGSYTILNLICNNCNTKFRLSYNNFISKKSGCSICGNKEAGKRQLIFQ